MTLTPDQYKVAKAFGKMSVMDPNYHKARDEAEKITGLKLNPLTQDRIMESKGKNFNIPTADEIKKDKEFTELLLRISLGR